MGEFEEEELLPTRACGVGTRMGIHKGIDRYFSVIARGMAPYPTLRSFLQVTKNEKKNKQT